MVGRCRSGTYDVGQHRSGGAWCTLDGGGQSIVGSVVVVR